MECNWKRHHTQVRAKLHMRVLFVRDVNTVIVEARVRVTVTGDNDFYFQLTSLEQGGLQV